MTSKPETAPATVIPASAPLTDQMAMPPTQKQHAKITTPEAEPATKTAQ